MNVILLEKNIFSAQDLKAAFKKAGLENATVLTLEAAQNSLRTGELRYDAAIISAQTYDILPTAAALRENSKLLPLAAVLDRYDSAMAQQALYDGADDVFDMYEHEAVIAAKMKALIRRPTNLRQAAIISFGRLAIDEGTKSLTLDNKPVETTALEYAVIHAIASHDKGYLGRDALIEKLCAQGTFMKESSVYPVITRIRANFRRRGYDGIKTQHGRGYYLDEAAP